MKHNRPKGSLLQLASGVLEPPTKKKTTCWKMQNGAQPSRWNLKEIKSPTSQHRLTVHMFKGTSCVDSPISTWPQKQGVRTFNEASKEDQQEEGICHQGLSVKSPVKRSQHSTVTGHSNVNCSSKIGLIWTILMFCRFLIRSTFLSDGTYYE